MDLLWEWSKIGNALLVSDGGQISLSLSKQGGYITPYEHRIKRTAKLKNFLCTLSSL